MSARTILNPPLINELNGLFNGTGTIDTGTVSASYFTTTTAGTSTFDDISAVGSITAPYFTTSAGGTSTFDDISAVGSITTTNNATIDGTLSVGSSIASPTVCFQLSELGGVNYVNMNVSDVYPNCLNVSQNLSVPETVYASAFRGGISRVLVTNTTNPIGPGGYQNFNATLENFAGSANSCYVATLNSVIYSFNLQCNLSFISYDATTNSTAVQLQLTNVGNAGATLGSFTFTFSIIGMN